VLQNAKFVAGLYGLGSFSRGRRIKEVLSFLEIWDARHRLGRDISGGMQRRLSLACALFHRPSLVFVDEPTSGLDPVLRAKIWQHLQQLRDGGTTIVLSTQYIDEAEYCDRVAILNKGAVIAEGEPEELRRSAIGGEALDVEGDSFSRGDIQALWSLDEVETIRWNGKNELRLMVHDAATATPAVTQVLSDRGAAVTAVRPYVPSFEEVFVELVGRR
jgi:ABC-2 type transport system ATP-binding protein